MTVEGVDSMANQDRLAGYDKTQTRFQEQAHAYPPNEAGSSQDSRRHEVPESPSLRFGDKRFPWQCQWPGSVVISRYATTLMEAVSLVLRNRLVAGATQASPSGGAEHSPNRWMRPGVFVI